MIEHRLTTSRRARYYSLGGGGSVTSVWIVCHGFGQLASTFLQAFDGVATAERIVVAPEALNRFYLTTDADGSHAAARVGTTWMTREDRDAEIADYVDFLDAVYRQTVPANAMVTVLGFSQGAATAARWVGLGTSMVHRLVLWAGQLPPDIDTGALRAKLTGSVALVCGDEDEHRPWVQLESGRARLQATGLQVQEHAFKGGHRLDRDTLAELARS